MVIKRKGLLNSLFKLSVLILAAVFIYFKLSNNANLQNFRTLINNIPVYQLSLTLSAVFLLMLLNWFIEALKWRFLVKRIEHITIWRSVESVFCGLTMAIFTPNRIGEYGGRVFFLSPKRRILGVLAMGVGAVGQMVITNVLGAIALAWFSISFLNIGKWANVLIAVSACVYGALFLLLYLRINHLLYLLTKVSFLKKFIKFFRYLSGYRYPELLKVFIYCSARFLVFTSQYCLLINMLVPQIPIYQMAMMVFILFFIQSALPSLDLLDVGVRTLTASYFFSFITHQDVAIIASTAFIWLINIIMPAILGSAFVFKLNLFGTTNS